MVNPAATVYRSRRRGRKRIMSHRQSCDRCRQQKVRCLRDEAPTGESNPASSGRTSLSRCERCTKAGVDCVYSLTSTAAKQRSNRRSVQGSIRIGTDSGPRHLNNGPWYDQGISGALYAGGPSLGTDFTDLVGQFPNLDESGTVTGFNCWDANLQPFLPNSLNSLTASSAAEPAPVSTASSTPDGRDDSDDADDDKDTADALSSQLASLSQRATRATRRLVRPGRAPLTVSSSEVNEALENTNKLIRIMNNITAPDHDDVALDSTTTNYGLAFSALACHQHLVALFRAICDTIHHCIQSGKVQLQQSHRSLHHSDVGPSSVAQFVMVLQLLMHLINRMDRSLFQNNPSTWHGTAFSIDDHTTPITPNGISQHTIDPIQLDATSGGSSPRGGLIYLVHDIVGTIPNEHEKLRQAIQKLQTEMEHSEIH